MKKICFLVPAHNEAKVIGNTLRSLLVLVTSNDIYVVDDGSTDETKNIAKTYTKNVLQVYPNIGKANAMNKAIKHFDLTEKYEYIMPMDADTEISPNFLKETLPILDTDKERKIACLVGKVVGKIDNWITLYRIWEYEIAQSVHKSAQSSENAIIVCPGCATIYRSDVFKNIMIPTGTLTEDMDFTFLIHRRKLGKIVYVKKALVYTQDPNTLSDLVKQLSRWYTGFWQCLIKHNIPWGGQILDFEVTMLALEGLFNGLLVLALIVFMLTFINKGLNILAITLVLDFILFLLPTIILVSIRHKFWKFFIYIPNFYFLRLLSSSVFFYSYLRLCLGFEKKLLWTKVVRY